MSSLCALMVYPYSLLLPCFDSYWIAFLNWSLILLLQRPLRTCFQRYSWDAYPAIGALTFVSIYIT